MIDQQTVENARKWVEDGAKWIQNNAFSMGVKYLDRAIPVFAEAHDITWLTYAQHQRMLGLSGMGRHEEVESAFEEVMRGYVELEDPYGKTLALHHAAEDDRKRGRFEQGISLLNLARHMAQSHDLKDLEAAILTQKADMEQQRGNLVAASRAWREAEKRFDGLKQDDESLNCRLKLADVLVALGERSEALALLEDGQARLFRDQKYRLALEPLRKLSQLYEESAMWNEKERVTQMIQFCGQYIIQHRDQQAKPVTRKPQVEKSVARNAFTHGLWPEF